MAANEAQIRSVDDVRRDLAAVLAGFRGGSSFAFSFGDDGRPEAVLLTYGEYDDLGGPGKFAGTGEVLTVVAVQAQLPAIRGGAFERPVLCRDAGEAEAVIMSPRQYRLLRGDDEPPAGVVDDPTVRAYDTKPLDEPGDDHRRVRRDDGTRDAAAAGGDPARRRRADMSEPPEFGLLSGEGFLEDFRRIAAEADADPGGKADVLRKQLLREMKDLASGKYRRQSWSMLCQEL